MKKFKFAILDGAVFGALVALAWGKSAQTILLAVVAFLLYLLVRSKLPKSNSASPVSRVSDDSHFLVCNDESSLVQIDLDSDISFQPRKNHFRLDLGFDTVSRDAEYEYKVEGTKVFVRLLHESCEDIGLEKYWEVRDGVVQEADLRDRWKTQKTVLKQNADEEISARQKSVEWYELLLPSFNGLKYFILFKNLPRDDQRRFFRQEIERLKLGSNRFIEQAAKVGFIHDENSEWRLRLPDGVDPPQEQRQKLSDSISSFGISYDEVTMAPRLIAALEKYCA